MNEFWDTRTELNEDELFDTQTEIDKDEFWDAKTDNAIYSEEAIEKENDNISPSIITENSRLSKETSMLSDEDSNLSKETSRKLEKDKQEQNNKYESRHQMKGRRRNKLMPYLTCFLILFGKVTLGEENEEYFKTNKIHKVI